MEQLPEEVLLRVFHFLDYDWLLCVVRLVNRRWSQLACEPSLLRHFRPEPYWCTARAAHELVRVSGSVRYLRVASDDVLLTLIKQATKLEEQRTSMEEAPCLELPSLRRVELLFVNTGSVFPQLALCAPNLTHLIAHSSCSVMLSDLVTVAKSLPKLQIQALIRLHQVEFESAAPLLLEFLEERFDITLQFLSFDAFDADLCNMLQKLSNHFKFFFKQQFSSGVLEATSLLQSVGPKLRALRLRSPSFESLLKISRHCSHLTTLDCKLAQLCLQQSSETLSTTSFANLRDLTLKCHEYRYFERASSRGQQVALMLKLCPALKRLCLVCMKITAEALKVFPTNLETVRFQDVYFQSDLGSSEASAHALRTVSLEYKQLSDACTVLHALESCMSRLHTLTLYSEQHDRDSLQRLSRALSLCTALRNCTLIFATEATSTDAVHQLLSHLCNCRSVTLHGLSRFVSYFLQQESRGSDRNSQTHHGSRLALASQQVDTKIQISGDLDPKEFNDFGENLPSLQTSSASLNSRRHLLDSKPLSQLQAFHCDLKPEDQLEAIHCLQQLSELTSCTVHTEFKAEDLGLWRAAFPLARLELQHNHRMQMYCAPLSVRRQLTV